AGPGAPHDRRPAGDRRRPRAVAAPRGRRRGARHGGARGPARSRRPDRRAGGPARPPARGRRPAPRPGPDPRRDRRAARAAARDGQLAPAPRARRARVVGEGGPVTRREKPRPVADRLAGLPAPGEAEARSRAWRLVAAAHAARPEADRSHGRRWVAVAAATCALVVAAAFTPPGEAVAEWVGRTVRAVVAPPPSRPAGLGVLPGGGRLLVLAGSGARSAPHIAGDRGRRRLLGAIGEATGSGHGRFLAATRGIELIVVDLAGRRRRSLAAPAPV